MINTAVLLPILCFLGVVLASPWDMMDDFLADMKSDMAWISDPIVGSVNDTLELPNARPEAKNFTADSVEEVLKEVGARIKDPKLKQLFLNCLPSTLDTTVWWHSGSVDRPKTFIITGDIPAMWLRDSCYQVEPYLRIAKEKNDAKLKVLIEGVVNQQADFLLEYPYGNAFIAPEEYEVPYNPNRWALSDIVVPPWDVKKVHEAKYELDSLASFLYITNMYFNTFGESPFVEDPQWLRAAEVVVNTMKKQQQGTYDPETRKEVPYKFRRNADSSSETNTNGGEGNPVKRCGLIRSFFRPSDDSTLFQYLIPSNAMAVVALEGSAGMMKASKKSTEAHIKLASEMEILATEVRKAINDWAIVEAPNGKKIYAYEVDCYGSQHLMDDANVPSLLALPHIGYLKTDDEIYKNTREFVLSLDNPYYFSGKYEGVGSPHTGFMKPWHMSIAMRALTSENRTEIVHCLEMLRDSTAGTGQMHESFYKDEPESFSRSWFAWANTVFGQLILDINSRYPDLLARDYPDDDNAAALAAPAFVGAAALSVVVLLQ